MGWVVFLCNATTTQRCDCISVQWECVYIRCSSVWPLMSDLDDLELKELASQVPGTVLKSKADSSYHEM